MPEMDFQNARLNVVDRDRELNNFRGFMSYYDKLPRNQQVTVDLDKIKADFPQANIDMIRKDYNIPDRKQLVSDYSKLHDENLKKPSVFWVMGGGNPEDNAAQAIARKYDIDEFIVRKWVKANTDFYAAAAGLSSAVKGASAGLIKLPGQKELKKEFPITSVVGEMVGAALPIAGASNVAGKLVGNIPKFAELPQIAQTVAKTGIAGALYSGTEQAIDGDVKATKMVEDAALWAGLGALGEGVGAVVRRLRTVKNYREAAKMLKDELETYGAPVRPLDDYINFVVKQHGIPIGTPMEIKGTQVLSAFGKKEHIRSGATLYDTIFEEPALRQQLAENEPYTKGIPGFVKKGNYIKDKRTSDIWQIGSSNPKKNRITLFRFDEAGHKIKKVENFENLNLHFKKSAPLQTGTWEPEIFEYQATNQKIPVETMPQWGDDFVKVGAGKTVYYRDGIQGWINKNTGEVAKGNALNALNFYDNINKPNESGFLRLPSQEDFSKAGVTLSKLNLYSNYVGNKIWAGLEKLPNILPESVARYFLTNYGTRGEFVALARREFAEAGMSIQDGITYADQLSKKLTKSEQLELTKLLTNPQRKGLQYARGTDFEGTVERMQTDLKDLMNQAVAEGLFTENTAKFYEDRYLPKLHKKYFEQENRMKYGKYKFSGRTKARGKSVKVKEDELEDYIGRGYEIYSENNGEFILRKFEPYGDITEATGLYAKGMADLSRDIALARILKKVSENPKWVSNLPADDFVPMTKTSLFRNEFSSKFLKINDIGNKYIHKDIHKELQDLVLMRANWQKFLSGLMGMWKIQKTGYSLMTHVRNLASNVVLADMGGLSLYRRPDIYITAMKEMANGGQYLNEARLAGIFGQDFYSREVKEMLKAASGTTKPMSMLYKILNNKYASAPARLYQAEEQWFKMAKFIHNRQRGMSIDDSAEDALKWLFDYSNVSRFVGLLRKTAFPFVTFTAKAAPRVAETAIKHPFRLAKYYLAYQGIQAYSRANLGLSGEEYNNLMENRPDYMQHGWWMLMPNRDSNGNFQFMNLTYYAPWGNFLDNAPQQGLEWMPQPIYDILVPNNPFVRLPYELAYNKSLFTQQPIRKPEESMLGAGAKYVAQTAVSPDVPFIGARWGKWTNLAKGVVGAETTPNRYGEQPSAGDTFNRIMGAQPVNLQRQKNYDVAAKKRQVDELMSRMLSVTNDLSLSEEQRMKKIEKLRSMMQKILKEK